MMPVLPLYLCHMPTYGTLDVVRYARTLYGWFDSTTKNLPCIFGWIRGNVECVWI
ncbi:hypothetical protein BCR34DRAFT_556158 [Clohesyomyces aquaticus]|uniref:Uncharacterized protein n=1 Tax=Clohesyomyces aquaticus TaxID=1231657 RepID=A0A1Y2A3S4_9PLEO|nr:hypothetical protein BCR34DRAFT_556158 [Clohesyomyces aquaticus]